MSEDVSVVLNVYLKNLPFQNGKQEVLKRLLLAESDLSNTSLYSVSTCKDVMVKLGMDPVFHVQEEFLRCVNLLAPQNKGPVQ